MLIALLKLSCMVYIEFQQTCFEFNSVRGEVSAVKNMRIWDLIPPRKEHIKRLVELAKYNENCRRNVSVEDWKYLEALLQASWEEIRSPAVLERLAPVVETILKCLVENGVAGKVWSLINPDCESIRKLVNKAGSCFRFLKPWERRSLSLNKLDKALLKALMDAFKDGCIGKVRSRILLSALAPIMEKLLKVVGKAFKGIIVLVREAVNVGEELARAVVSLRLPSAYRLAKQVAVRISHIAHAWGNRMARTWPEDPHFIRYLLMMMSYKENFPGAAIT